MGSMHVIENMEPISKESNFCRRIFVNLIDMEWGGQHLANPPHYGCGYVLDRALKGPQIAPFVTIDFESYFGI